MTNRLKMVQVHTIEGLRSQGWSYRRIARELGIHRETVRNYVLRLTAESQNRPNLTPGKSADLSPPGAFPALPENSKPATNPTAGSSGPKSKCEALHDVIVAKLELDLSAQRIYQDLVGERKFEGSYTVAEYASPDEARRALEGDGPEWDLLLTDIVMPGMSGAELARALRARYPRMDVVYMSGYTEETTLGRVEEGAGFIAKPFVLGDLLTRVRKTLDRAESSRAEGTASGDTPIKPAGLK